jgi:hypothetical protein
MYLTGDAKPDFRTIARFKKDCKELIETTFKKTVTTAKAAGILNLAHLSTDGTKLKANASRTIIEQHVLGDDSDKERVIEKLDKAKEELNKSDQGAVSITDPESRFMQNKKGWKELSYNPQITVDSDSGIIAANGDVLVRKGEYMVKGKLQYSYI